MSTPGDDLATHDATTVLRRYGPGDVPALLDTLVEVWADAHADHRGVAEAGLPPPHRPDGSTAPDPGRQQGHRSAPSP